MSSVFGCIDVTDSNNGSFIHKTFKTINFIVITICMAYHTRKQCENG